MIRFPEAPGRAVPRALRHGYTRALASAYVLALIAAAVQVVLIPLYVRFLGFEGFGILVTLLAGTSLVGIGVVWAAAGSLRLMGEAHARRDAASFKAAFLTTKVLYLGYNGTLAAVILAFVAFAGRGLQVPGIDGRVVSALPWCALYLFVQADFATDNLALTAMRRPASANLLQALSQAIFVAVVVPGLVAFSFGVGGVFAALTLGLFMGRLLSGLFVLRSRAASSPALRWTDIQSDLRRLSGPMGRGYGLYGIIILAAQADTIILSAYGGPALAARFAIVWKIADFAIQMLSRLPSMYAPYVIEKDALGRASDLIDPYRKGMRWVFVLAALCGAAFAFAGGPIVRVWLNLDLGGLGPLAFALGGLAIFWLGSAQWPIGVMYSMVNLRVLNAIAAAEVGGRVLLTVALLPFASFLAPLISITIMHAAGVAALYRRHAKRTLEARIARTSLGGPDVQPNT